MGTFVRLWRQIIDHRVFLDAELLKLFIYCLVRANHKPATVHVKFGRKHHSVDIGRGEFVTGLRKIANDLGYAKTTIRERLARLQKIGCIEFCPDTHLSLIRVANYDQYQRSASGGRTRAGQQGGHQTRPANLGGLSQDSSLFSETADDGDGQPDESVPDPNKKDNKKQSLGERPSRASFVEPSIAEVQDHASSLGYANFDAEHFWAHHKSTGWKMTGGRAIVDWRAAVVTWQRMAFRFDRDPRNSNGFSHSSQPVFKSRK